MIKRKGNPIRIIQFRTKIALLCIILYFEIKPKIALFDLKLYLHPARSRSDPNLTLSGIYPHFQIFQSIFLSFP